MPDKNENCRAPFIIAHIRQVRRAKFEGVNVMGYLYWSLFDSYEWHHGYSEDSRFGLFHIGKTNLGERVLTSGARALGIIIQESSQENEGDVLESATAKALKLYGSYSADGSRIE